MNQSIHHMQRYVLGAVGLMAAIAASFPVAMARVSSTEKLAGQAVNSYTCAGRPPAQRQVLAWAESCGSKTVKPIAK